MKNFILSGGTTNLNTLRGYLTGIRLKCDLTIVRATGGVLTWWGRSDAQVPVCASLKGGTWAVAKIEQSDGTASFLSRTTDAWGLERRPVCTPCEVSHLEPGAGQS